MGVFRFILLFCFASRATSASKIDYDCMPLRNFVAQYTKFFNQIPTHTYPVYSFCSNNTMADEYQKSVEWFHYAQINETCQKNLNLNRLNVFQKMFDQMTSIWEDAHCQDCVSNQNDTAEFIKNYDELTLCTQIYHNACEDCAGNYSHIQVFYEQLVQNRKGSLCFDIEDRMNQTRYAWSATYNCCKDKQHSQKAFIWFASGISSLPLIFYLMMYLITRRKEARERAAAPLLNDQSVEIQDEPQASSSCESQQVQDEEIEYNPSSMESEPKLNNLDKAGNVRESKLIDLDDSKPNENLNTQHNLKSLAIKHDEDDDVSILKIPTTSNANDSFP